VAGFDFDLFVVGGGSGGVRAARVAARAGARVGLAEEYRYGGTCVVRGCVPKKLMTYAAGFADAFDDAAGYGWTVEPPRFDWRSFIAAKDAEIARLEAAYHDTLREAGVQLCGVRASLVDPHRIRLANGAEYATRHILIATGSRPRRPGIPGAELGISSDEMFQLDALPERLVIIGGGYIACEFASIMNGLGSHVTVLNRGDQILRGFDDDLRDHLAGALRARGIVIEIQREAAAIAPAGGRLSVTADNGETHPADQVLFATGRDPHTGGLGLERLGVGLAANGAVMVDDWSQTAVPSIFAVGDVTDRDQLTPVAIREAQAFAQTVFAGRPTRFDRALVPTAVFTRPELATLGLTEAEARAGGEVEIYRTRHRPMLNTLSGRAERVLMKLVVGKASRRVLGVHIVGPAASEMIQLAAVAVGMGATKEDFDRTLAVHPTSAEELVTMHAPERMAS
jgi:glutathione reductase (NADPH)